MVKERWQQLVKFIKTITSKSKFDLNGVYQPSPITRTAQPGPVPAHCRGTIDGYSIKDGGKGEIR